MLRIVKPGFKGNYMFLMVSGTSSIMGIYKAKYGDLYFNNYHETDSWYQLCPNVFKYLRRAI